MNSSYTTYFVKVSAYYDNNNRYLCGQYFENRGYEGKEWQRMRVVYEEEKRISAGERNRGLFFEAQSSDTRVG